MTEFQRQSSPEELRARTAEVTDTIETVFETASVRLFELLEVIGQRTDLLQRVSEASGARGREALMRTAQTTQKTLDEVEEQFAFLSRTAKKLEKRAPELRMLINQQSSDMRMTGMIATNAQVVSRTVPGNDHSMAQFAEDVRNLLGNAESSVTALQINLKASDDALRGLVPAIRDMSAAASELKSMRDRLPTLVSELANDGELDQASVRLRSGLFKYRKALEKLVSDLQVGDAARQRLEHVQKIIDQIPLMEDAEDASLLAELARVQTAATLTALQTSLARILPELERIKDPWSTSSREIGNLARSHIRDRLRAISKLTDHFVSDLGSLRKRLDRIIPEMTHVAELYAGSAERAKTVSGLEDRMNLLGVNAILVSSRIGTEGRAMMEVSRQLSDSTSNIGTRTAVIVQLAQMQEFDACLFSCPISKDAAPMEAVRNLADNLGTLDRSMDEIEAVLIEKKGGDPVIEVRKMLSDFVASVEQRLNQGGDMPFRRHLTPHQQSLMDEMRGHYTMAAEREVHDAMFGSAVTTVDAPAQQAASGDVFF